MRLTSAPDISVLSHSLELMLHLTKISFLELLCSSRLFPLRIHTASPPCFICYFVCVLEMMASFIKHDSNICMRVSCLFSCI